MAAAKTIEIARACVMAAIERVEKARQAHIDAEFDAKANMLDRMMADRRYRTTIEEFGWQWENVKNLLAEPPAQNPVEQFKAAVSQVLNEATETKI